MLLCQCYFLIPYYSIFMEYCGIRLKVFFYATCSIFIRFSKSTLMIYPIWPYILDFLILVLLLSDLTLYFVITWNCSITKKLKENISIYEHKSSSCQSFSSVCFYSIIYFNLLGLLVLYYFFVSTFEPLSVSCSSLCSLDTMVNYFNHSCSNTQSFLIAFSFYILLFSFGMREDLF